MARDLEVIEADSEIGLKSKVQEFLEENTNKIIDVSYATYTDYETKELVYSAGIIFEIFQP